MSRDRFIGWFQRLSSPVWPHLWQSFKYALGSSTACSRRNCDEAQNKISLTYPFPYPLSSLSSQQLNTSCLYPHSQLSHKNTWINTHGWHLHNSFTYTRFTQLQSVEDYSPIKYYVHSSLGNVEQNEFHQYFSHTILRLFIYNATFKNIFFNFVKTQ